MFKSKYSTVLTIFLIVLIVAILIIITILSINAYKDYKEEKDRKQIIADFQENFEDNENTIDEDETYGNTVIQPIGTEEQTGTSQSGTSSSRPKTTFYKEYPMIGYITIEKTNIQYPILLDISPAALEVAVGVMYPSNPELNEPGNTVIIGHNYRNGKLFSNNKKLSIGDKIKITDLNRKTLTYTIYEISTIPETDTEYITRDRGNNTEISLSTCTDDGKARLVILARAE